jgi:hypothetical protein
MSSCLAQLCPAFQGALPFTSDTWGQEAWATEADAFQVRGASAGGCDGQLGVGVAVPQCCVLGSREALGFSRIRLDPPRAVLHADGKVQGRKDTRQKRTVGRHGAGPVQPPRSAKKQDKRGPNGQGGATCRSSSATSMRGFLCVSKIKSMIPFRSSSLRLSRSPFLRMMRTKSSCEHGGRQTSGKHAPSKT